MEKEGFTESKNAEDEHTYLPSKYLTVFTWKGHAHCKETLILLNEYGCPRVFNKEATWFF